VSGSRVTDRRGISALLAGANILGFSAVFVRLASPAAPVVIGFYRMLFALPFVLSMASRETRSFPKFEDAKWAMAAGIAFVADLALWHTAIGYTSAASATLIVGIAPLWVSLAMVLFMGARLGARAWSGLVLALLGAAVLGIAAKARLGSGFGELLSLGASFAYAVSTLCLSKARRRLGARTSLALMVSCSLFGFGLLGWMRGDVFIGLPGRSWMAMMGLGLVVQSLAWWLISWGIGRIPANVGSLGLLFQQVSTVLLVWILLKETPSIIQLTGAALIVAGIGLAATSGPQMTEPRTKMDSSPISG
jgi:drug/metabolite transporter (DMT)-like permease